MNPLADYLHAKKFTDAAAAEEGGVWYSEPEIRLREALISRGFYFVQQKRIQRGSSSAVLDFFVEDALAVEVDGSAYHDASSDAHRDHDLLIDHGIWTIRVPGWKALKYPEEAVCLIALKLSELGVSGKAAAA